MVVVAVADVVVVAVAVVVAVGVGVAVMADLKPCPFCRAFESRLREFLRAEVAAHESVMDHEHVVGALGYPTKGDRELTAAGAIAALQSTARKVLGEEVGKP